MEPVWSHSVTAVVAVITALGGRAILDWVVAMRKQTADRATGEAATAIHALQAEADVDDKVSRGWQRLVRKLEREGEATKKQLAAVWVRVDELTAEHAQCKVENKLVMHDNEQLRAQNADQETRLRKQAEDMAALRGRLAEKGIIPDTRDHPPLNTTPTTEQRC